jgi:hypothetical protein
MSSDKKDDEAMKAEENVRKAAAWDLEQIAKRHAPRLRRVGQDELADKIEQAARDLRANAEEHDSLGEG